MQPNVDTLRTNLYDPGKLAVVYLKHKIYKNDIDFNSEISSSVDPYSDWSFNRITFSSKFQIFKIHSLLIIFLGMLVLHMVDIEEDFSQVKFGRTSKEFQIKRPIT